jgi:rare lipoprotein A
VNGKTYRIIENSKGFEQVGYASWYGKKFHGQRTSNGEIYDMYGMTAAHKTLPIPCFVELTNIENGSKVVVRINDRGPFHGDRIIDLTYTAARKLGIAKSGTGKVKLRVIEPSDQAHFAGLGEHHSEQLALTNNQAPKPRNSGGYEIPERTYLQLGAFSELARAKNLQYGAAKLTTYPVSIEPVVEKAIYRVLLGPLKDNWDLVHLQKHFVANGFIEPKIVYR